jgi:hypothetical protein
MARAPSCCSGAAGCDSRRRIWPSRHKSGSLPAMKSSAPISTWYSCGCRRPSSSRASRPPRCDRGRSSPATSGWRPPCSTITSGGLCRLICPTSAAIAGRSIRHTATSSRRFGRGSSARSRTHGRAATRRMSPCSIGNAAATSQSTRRPRNWRSGGGSTARMTAPITTCWRTTSTPKSRRIAGSSTATSRSR